MKGRVSLLILLHMLQIHVIAVLHLPKINVYPNALRPDMYFTRPPRLTREENRLAEAALSSESGLDIAGLCLDFSPQSLFSIFNAPLAPFNPFVFNSSAYTKIQRALSFIQPPPDLMIWFSLLGWYP